MVPPESAESSPQDPSDSSPASALEVNVDGNVLLAVLKAEEMLFNGLVAAQAKTTGAEGWNCDKPSALAVDVSDTQDLLQNSDSENLSRSPPGFII